MIATQYQIGGSLEHNDPHYVIRVADTQLYEALMSGEFCYIFNCRQMGKSSLLVRTLHRLRREGYQCTVIDMTNIGSENITPIQWYKGIMYDLGLGFNWLSEINADVEKLEGKGLSTLKILSQLIDKLLTVRFPKERIFIFIDEIDSVLSLKFSIDDFFALIRYCYNQRNIDENYHRITFAMFGVATPSDLISDKKRTPFNIGRAIELEGFKWEEAQPLIQGMKAKTLCPEPFLRAILDWTSGQPFLTQKLCDLVVKYLGKRENLNREISAELMVEEIARSHLIQNWESQDEPEHFRTIRDRLLGNPKNAGRLLSIYQQIWQGLEVIADDSREQIELILSGIVIKSGGYLKIRNKIYREVFNLTWIEKQLHTLRPYSQSFEAWIDSQKLDPSRLLSGQALIDAQNWARGKSLSNLDYQFLAESEEQDRLRVQQELEAARLKEVEFRLLEKQQRLLQEQKNAQLQKILLGAVSLGLLLSVGLGLIGFWQYRQARRNEQLARRSEIKALLSSSNGQFASVQRLSALVSAIKAQRRLEQFDKNNPRLARQIESALQEAVYGAIEINRFVQEGIVTDIALHPQGHCIASTHNEGGIRLWKPDGTLLRTFGNLQQSYSNVEFSPDGQSIAAASSDRTVQLWNLNGQLLRTLNGHSGPVNSIAFSPNGQAIASGSSDRTIRLWNLQGKLQQTLVGHQDRILAVTFSPDGQTLASTSMDGTVKLWNLNGELLQEISTEAPIGQLAFSPDGQWMAGAEWNERIFVWQRDGTLKATFEGHTHSVSSVAFSPDSQYLLSGSRDRTLRLWDLQGTLLATLEGHKGGVTTVLFTPNGQTLISSSRDGTIRLWQLHHPDVTVLRGHARSVNALQILPSPTHKGAEILTAGDDGTLRWWTRQGTAIASIRAHEKIGGMDINSDGSQIVTSSSDQTLKLWNREGQLLKTFNPNQGILGQVAFSPDDRAIAVLGFDRTLKLWTTDGQLLHSFTSAQTLRSFAFSPDAQRIASIDYTGKLFIWRIDGTLEQTAQVSDSEGYAIAFSPDSRQLAIAKENGAIYLWQMNGSLQRTWKAHLQAVRHIAFSPDGKMIATAGQEGEIKLWTLEGKWLTTLKRHEREVYQLVFSADGQTLVSGSRDRTAIIWNLPEVMDRRRIFANGCDWVREYLQTSSEIERSDRTLCP
ncbi:AAA-like domain-containing protein [Desertifilum sp. FACHB-1129]|uniref:WD40 domain-containing protein n=1 Tax=unclassified Desertifilum TaxID=2621682 RepID=UPI001684E9D4|nr:MULTISPECIES: AAA-like domain-containing protein [unclassified Desertifilum]MBD2310354.1 AAA-like domain-containing protein [Desertifilum sp. FACHB-1129]MBD2321805.1 AAA-like domain-containing protein [Desertifilum sp. FACHB-866]MBD2331932.1 AAA-like domain-containing protein [Desertifilum sp. FACHB-868]MDA0213293.1 AAA-like domain-containing protein [Cyanobacteria bacterium FC1]